MGAESLSQPAVPALVKGSNFAKGGGGKKEGADADTIAAAVTKITTQRKTADAVAGPHTPESFSPLVQRKEEHPKGATKDGGMAIGPYKPMQLKAVGTSATVQRYEPAHEKQLPHEAGQVQQKQVSGSPALQAKGIAINDDAGLEKEADEMGSKAAQMKTIGNLQPSS